MKKSVMQGILENAAIHVASQRGILPERPDRLIMPENPRKRRQMLDSMIDRAVYSLFEEGISKNSVESFSSVLMQAKQYNVCIKNYRSMNIERCNSCDVFVRTAVLHINEGRISVNISVDFGRLNITTECITTKGTINKKNHEKVMQFSLKLQKALIEIEKEL